MLCFFKNRMKEIEVNIIMQLWFRHKKGKNQHINKAKTEKQTFASTARKQFQKHKIQSHDTKSPVDQQILILSLKTCRCQFYTALVLGVEPMSTLRSRLDSRISQMLLYYRLCQRLTCIFLS